jgi:hypothetical protein
MLATEQVAINVKCNAWIANGFKGTHVPTYRGRKN